MKLRRSICRGSVLFFLFIALCFPGRSGAVHLLLAYEAIGTLNQVIYVKGTYVAVGANGAIFTSPRMPQPRSTRPTLKKLGSGDVLPPEPCVRFFKTLHLLRFTLDVLIDIQRHSHVFSGRHRA